MAVQVAATSSSGFSSESNKFRYDVFLSFRGKDTRHSFTVPLYDALRRKGIIPFIDDKKLGKGGRIAPTLLKAIKRSRISIIVFSINYATSTWCLDELAHIIWCMKEKNQLVVPIFYKVDPRDVQYQRNGFEEAMATHEERFRNEAEKVKNSFEVDSAAHEDRLRKNLEKLQKWRSALSDAASLSSARLLEDGYDEGVFIESIVEDAYARLPPKRFHNVDYIVGLEPRVEKVMSLLNETNNSVCMLGIHGTGGIGKTTLAKDIYKSISHHFEGSCFLFDVREASKKYQGVVRLQQTLLSEILEEKIMMFGGVDEGISRIKHRLSHKKVLLVLDDVEEAEQLEKLAGGCDWFGCGSKVIITTRNRHLLITRNVEKTYEMMKLNKHYSLELFCWHAFQMSQPPKIYQDMCSCAISYAKGLPLALRVIGSNLADKNIEEWRSILEQYERIPERTTHEVLKISYDCLEKGAKRIFLDIACFIDEEKLRSMDEIAEACEFDARFYLEVLIDKSLLTLVENNCLYMHDLIRQMGREIIKQKAPSNPELWSRLWYYKDILKVLRENSGCNNIEGIMLNPPQKEKVKWSGKAFEKMNNLRILIIRNVQFSTGPTYLPNSLRWLEWEGYPSTTLPADFSPLELVFFKLPRSAFGLKQPFESFSNHVTRMDFSYCKSITEIPDMSGLQNLRSLRFAYCQNLIKIHESVGSLSKLYQLDVYECPKLSIFPCEINMPSLEWLSLKNCMKLDYFPNVVGKMDSVMVIAIEATAIKELPPSIGNLSSLQCLYMYSCKSLGKLPTNLFTLLPKLGCLDLGGVHPLTRKSLMKLLQDMQPLVNYHTNTLHLRNCGLLDDELPLILNYFRNLQELYISRNDFESLPECIKLCDELRWLDVSDCKWLRDIPELPSKLRDINAENCTSLTTESFDRLYSQAKMELIDLAITMPATTTFPDWFDYSCEGSTLRLRVRRRNLLPRAALAFEVVGKFNTRGPVHCCFLVCMSINGSKIMKADFHALGKGIPLKTAFGARPGHHVLLCERFMDFTEEEQEDISMCMELDWNEVEIQVVSESPDMSSVVKCGVYVYKKETNMKNLQFKPYNNASTTSLKRNRRAIASPPTYEKPNKFMRVDKGKLSKTKKGSRRIKRHQTFHSCYRRKMAFPLGKQLVWRFLWH